MFCGVKPFLGALALSIKFNLVAVFFLKSMYH
jgi:hypothetical protein